MPTIFANPATIPSGLSVLSLQTNIFFLNVAPSSCIPPESLITNFTSLNNLINSSYLKGLVTITLVNMCLCFYYQNSPFGGV